MWGTPWVDQQWLAQVKLAGGLRHRRLGAAGGAAGGAGRLHDGRPGRDGTRAWGEPADRRDPRAGGVRPGRPGARAPAAAVRDRPVRRPAVADRGARAGRRGCTCWRPWSSCCGRTSTAASCWVPRCWDTRGSATSPRSGPHVSRCGSWSRARSRRSSTRTSPGRGPTRWGSAPTRPSPGRSASGSGRRRSRCPGCCSIPSVVVTVVLMLRRRDLVRWPDWVLVAAMALMGAWAVRGVAWWAFAMVFLLAGVLATRAPGARPARQRRERVHRRRAGRRHRGRAAVVASGRPADRPGGPAVLRAERPGGEGGRAAPAPAPGSSCRRRGAPGSSGRHRSRRTSSTPGSSSSRRTSGRTTRRCRVPMPARCWTAGRRTSWSFRPGEAMPSGPWDRAWEDADGTILVRAR